MNQTRTSTHARVSPCPGGSEPAPDGRGRSLRRRLPALLLALLLGPWLVLPPPARAQESDTETGTDAERVDELVRTLLEGTAPERRNAIQALRRLGPEARPRLEEALDRVEGARSVLRGILEATPEVEGEGAEDLPWDLRAYERARARFEREDYVGALRVIEAALTLGPRPAVQEEMTRLHVRCEEQLLQETAVRSELLPDRPVVGFGESIAVRLHLENTGDQSVRVLPPPGGGPIGTVVVVREAFDRSGNRSRTRRTQLVRLGEPVLLSPDDEWERRLVVESEGAAPGPAFVRYRISGALRPRSLDPQSPPDEAPTTLPSRFLPLLPVHVSVCDETYWPLAGRAAEHARETLEDLADDPPTSARPALHAKLFHACLLADPEAADDLIPRLMEALEALEGEDVTGQETITIILAYLTDRFVDLDPEVWRRWWRRRQR